MREARREQATFQEVADQVLVAVVFPIRRIHKDEFVSRRIALEEGNNLGFHRVAAIEAGFGEIFRDDLDCLAVLVDESAGCRTAAKRLQPERAGAGEKVEHAGVFHLLAEDGKNRLADEIRGRPGHG